MTTRPATKQERDAYISQRLTINEARALGRASEFLRERNLDPGADPGRAVIAFFEGARGRLLARGGNVRK